MSSKDPFPDFGLDMLLDAEREAPGPSTEVKRRVMDRVMASVAPVVPPAGPGSEAGGPPGQLSGPPAAPSAGGLVKGASVLGTKVLGTKMLALVGAAVVGGGLTIGGLYLSQGPPDQAVGPVEGPAVAPPSPTPALEPEPTVEPEGLPPGPASPEPGIQQPLSPVPEAGKAKKPPSRKVTSPRRSRPSRDRSLAAERRLLEAARADLAAGDPEAALRSLRRHGGSFASGRLAEERMALQVIALARAGRGEAASRAAARFRSRYPRSILLPAVQRAVGSIP